MLIGIFLAISIAVFLASLGMIIISVSGLLQRNMITGAVIGTAGIASYSLIALVLSLIAIFFLVLIVKKPKGTFNEKY
jgi:hypothetical protein